MPDDILNPASVEEELEHESEVGAKDSDVTDDASLDETTPQLSYAISSYGADYDVEGLFNRLERGDIVIPPFQRQYVWKLARASRLIESLLLGLPVPGIFLAKESDTNRLVVIDGQQRLRTIQFFYKGVFNPQPDANTQRKFSLQKVQAQFDGKAFNELDERDRIRLNDTIIHATVIKQEAPANDDTSIYHLFDRLNTGGLTLTAQEVRAAIDHGPFIEMLGRLNDLTSWREIFGPKSERLKDQELILRFLAMYFDLVGYQKPMSEFLNRFSKKHRKPTDAFVKECTSLFSGTIDVMLKAVGKTSFRPEQALNAAVFDSVMVAVAQRLAEIKKAPESKIKAAYDDLLNHEDFKTKIGKSTSDNANVRDRLALAVEHFSGV